MAEENNNNNSIILSNSVELDKIKNSLELTNKILISYSIKLVPYRINNLWYIYNIELNKIISESFNFIKFIDESLIYSKSLLLEKNKTFAILNNTKNILDLIWYKSIKTLDNDKKIMIVSYEEKKGLVNFENDILVPFIYDDIIDISKSDNLKSSGLLITIKNNKFGIIDTKDYDELLPANFDKISKIRYTDSDNILKIIKGNKVGVFDCILKKVLFLGNFEDVKASNNGICSVQINNKWFLYDYNSNRLINRFNYKLTGLFIDDYSICTRNNDYYIVYKNGNEIKFPVKESRKNSTKEIYRFDEIVIAEETVTTNIKRENVNVSKTKYLFHIYHNLMFKFTLKHERRYRDCRIKVTENNIIEILEIGKYGGYFPVKYFNLSGIELTKSEETIHLGCQTDKKTNKKSLIKSNKVINTNWKIIDEKLFYKNELVYEILNNKLEADLTLHFPKITVILDVDPEFGILEVVIGYIDQYGNKFWK